MKRTNTTLDREPMNSEAIRQRQDFNYILKEARAAKVPIWKSIWFYGPVGIAMVTMVVSAVRINPKNELNDKNATLSQIDAVGYSGSSELQKTLIFDEQSHPKSNEIGLDGKEEASAKKEDKNATEKATFVAEASDKVDNNTELKPEVLAEEKIDIVPQKSAQIPVKKPRKNRTLTTPNIAGIFNGKVSIDQMCVDGIIDCNNGFQIISYEIQYDNGAGSTVDRVSGNKIPSYVCRNLKRFNIGSPVFITKIVAMNEKGERQQLLSMNIEPTF